MRAMNIVSSSQTSRQWGPRCCCCVPAKDRAHRQLNLLLRAAASETHLSTGATGLAGLAAVLLLCHASPAQAHISITQPQQQQQAAVVQPTLPGSTAGFDPSAVGQIRARQPAGPISSRSRSSQASVTASEALEALQQLRAAEGQFQQGDYAAALQGYTAVVRQHPDLALTEYARLGQALCMYQEGSSNQALTELNELELDIRGNPETHAALAAVLYAERPNQRWRAEQQWDIAVEFDSRYQDPAWVRDNKHWPPRLLDALSRFLSLR